LHLSLPRNFCFSYRMVHVGATENCVFDIMEEKDSLSVAITRTVDLRLRKAFRAKGKGSLMEEECVDHLIAYFGGV
jgi:hypothetical protein